MEIEKVVELQREYFNNGYTRDIEVRKNNLIKLRKSIVDHMPQIMEAFRADYNKSEFDVLSTEVGMVMGEIKYMLKHLRSLSKPKRRHVSLMNIGSKSYILKEPYGVTLVVAPWNYPLQLSLTPLVGAIAAGNTVVLKPSNYSPQVSLVLKDILSVFDEGLVSVVLGGREQNQQLFDQHFDFIFFTGGVNVGRVLLGKASEHLTPVVLELGGKSPCIIDEDCDLDLAARRATWGKYLNAGQTCVAPDYFYVHRSIKEKFMAKVIWYIQSYYYDNGKISSDFPYIINDKHVERLKGLLGDKVFYGGKVEGRLFEPTILDNVTRQDAVMQEEIFGPIMPILEFEDITEVVNDIKSQPKPLALYYFGSNRDVQKYVMDTCSYGGGCVNDTIMHLTEEALPFGGVGNSGMGSYHGEKSFKTFSHEKSVLVKGKMELKFKYPPASDSKAKLIKTYFKIK